MIGGNRRKLLKTVDDSFNELYETKQNKVWYSDAEPSDIESEDGDLWISTTSSIIPPPIEYRDVDLLDYAANNIPNYTTITELPQDIEEYLSSGIRATNMRRAFYDCRYLKELDFNKYRINTSKCSIMWGAFRNCSSLIALDLSSFDTSNVSDMDSMFQGCSSLIALDLSSFDTSNVSTMYSMFDGCGLLTSLDLSSFDTSNVSTMSGMFNSCSSLTALDLSSFNTSSVRNMSFMFYECESLTSLNLSSFNTSNVTDMEYMFNRCSSLTALDLSSFDTSNVTDMSYMFSGCSSLTSLDLSSFDTSNVSDMDSMFHECTKLTEIKGVIDFHNYSNSIYYKDMFTRCPISSSTPVQIKNPPTEENWWKTAGFEKDVISFV